MNWEQLWAGIAFSAMGGRCEALLQAASQQGLRLRGVCPTDGGFTAKCPARRYRQLGRLARRYRVRLRVCRRTGLYFAIRSALSRKGLWLGLVLFALLVWQLQRLVWYIDCSGLTVGQAARVRQALRAVGLIPGAVVTQSLLTEAEYAVLALDGEFSWTSVNFEKGRITIECVIAKPVPSIDSEEITELLAKEDGMVLSVHPEDGTVQVVPGQQVTRGQTLIGVARAERDGSLNYRRAAGRVIAAVEWSDNVQVPLCTQQTLLTGQSVEWHELSFAGRCIEIGKPEGREISQALLRSSHRQLSFLGLPMPVALTTHTAFLCSEQTIVYSEMLATEKARLLCEQQLLRQFPDAQIDAWQAETFVDGGVLKLSVTAKLRADLCVRQGESAAENGA